MLGGRRSVRQLMDGDATEGLVLPRQIADLVGNLIGYRHHLQRTFLLLVSREQFGFRGELHTLIIIRTVSEFRMLKNGGKARSTLA